MRYIVAAFGAMLIFAAAFILSALLVSGGPAWLHPNVRIGSFGTNNPYGVVLATIAATFSWRGTLRHYAAKSTPNDALDSDNGNQTGEVANKGRQWTRGELQAFGAVANLMVTIGIIVLGVCWLNRDWPYFALGCVMVVAGVVLRILLYRYERRTGRSSIPFRS